MASKPPHQKAPIKRQAAPVYLIYTNIKAAIYPRLRYIYNKTPQTKRLACAL